MPYLLHFELSRTDMDLLMILGTIAFFIVAIAYTIACDKLK